MTPSKHQQRIAAAISRPASETKQMRNQERTKQGSSFIRFISGLKPGQQIELSRGRKYDVRKDGSLRRIN